LSGGTFNVTVTDANNCTASASATVVEPSALVATVNVDAQISCRLANDGEISVSATGGTGGYDYLWNDNLTTASRTTLAPGNYLVTVTDNNNCVATDDVTLSEPQGTSISPSVNQITCNNGTNGSIQLNAVSPL